MLVSTYERKNIDLRLNHRYMENDQQPVSLPALLGCRLIDVRSIFLGLVLILSIVHCCTGDAYVKIYGMHTTAPINERFKEL